MEKLTEKIETITNTEQLEQITKLLYIYHEDFKNCMDKADKETHNLKLHHELTYKYHNETYNNLGLNNYILKSNEDIITDEIVYFIEQLETDNINYIYELYNFNDIAIYLFKDYKIKINNEFHIIIDNENKEIYNLTEDNEQEIIKRIINERQLNKNESIKKYVLNIQYENTKEILYNDPEVNNLSFNNCNYYNKHDNYIIYDLIKDNWKTTKNINLSIEDLTEIIYLYDFEIIKYICENGY